MIILLQTAFQNTLTIKPTSSNSELIERIKGDPSKRNSALHHIYQNNREIVFSYVLKNSGSIDEAKDVYQESMIAFYENVRDNKFKGDSAISTYLYSIAKFKWLNQIKKNKVRTTHHDNLQVEQFDDGPLAQMLDAEKQAGIIDVLSELGESCKKLLIETIYHNASMKEIVLGGGYSNEQIVRNKKYKCLKKLKDLIRTRPSVLKFLRTNE